VPNDEFVDLESTDSGAADRQPTDGEGTDGQRANGDRGKRQRPDRMRPGRLCPDADRWEMSDASLASVPIFVDDDCTAFTRKHQRALDCWFCCRTK
jgi:hypothetical protein